MTEADYADDLAVFVNAQARAESQLHSLEQAVGCIGISATQIKQNSLV